MTKFLLAILCLSSLSIAQIETHKWETKTVDYLLQQNEEKSTTIKTNNVSTLLISSAQIIYHKLFSEYDGDNCPFYPSCSTFFVHAVDSLNIVFGSFLFADRFTRDLNFFKGFESYPIHQSGKFYDPVKKYICSVCENLIVTKKSQNE